jgi:hypothetical protein
MKGSASYGETSRSAKVFYTIPPLGENVLGPDSLVAEGKSTGLVALAFVPCV